MHIKHQSKRILKDVLSSIFSSTALTNFSNRPNNSLTVLTFHRILPQALRDVYPLPGLVCTPDELEWILSQLVMSFEILPLTAAIRQADAITKGKPVLAITFDDGQHDNLEYAVPILSNLGIQATFYVPTQFISNHKMLWHDEVGFPYQSLNNRERAELALENQLINENSAALSVKEFLQTLKSLAPPERSTILRQLSIEFSDYPEWARLLTWEELRTIMSEGHEIGSHSVTHPLLSDLNEREQQHEIINSAEQIQQMLGEPPKSFCYPDGNYNQTSISILESSYYENAVSTKPGINSPETNVYQISRFDMDPERLRDRNGKLSKPLLKYRLSRLHRER